MEGIHLSSEGITLHHLPIQECLIFLGEYEFIIDASFCMTSRLSFQLNKPRVTSVERIFVHLRF